MITAGRVGLLSEAFVDIGGELFYGIPSVDQMDPFLMSVLSDGDHWMFVSSRGGLTAGRGDTRSALFPFETDDRLHTARGVTGPITLIRHGGETWTPLLGVAVKGIARNVYKSAVGNRVIFEEIDESRDMVFRYEWANSDRFGFIRRATLSNLGSEPAEIEVLDGLLNVLPHGLDPTAYQTMSNLTNAYKRSELVHAATGLAVFSIESLISDRAEPAEALTANVVWSLGLEGADVTLDTGAVSMFRRGESIVPASLVTGRPGAYLLRASQSLQPGATADWVLGADVARTQAQVVDLIRLLCMGSGPAEIGASLERGTESLIALLASADGLQLTGDRMAAVHHFANVAFNSMRGGVFLSGTEVGRDDFIGYLRDRNRAVAARHEPLLEQMPAQIARDALFEHLAGADDPQLMRLVLGYLPIMFSRRHGDPSRPWNAFSIRVRDEAGAPVIHYQGNWRDIFQNWEALSMSFPDYLPAIVSVFLSASTPDGFNPYRITSEGIDWEVPEPDNPWSNIGYWGDHQIVYLNRLLQMARRFDPAGLDDLLGKRWFAYADVPYRIAPYEDIVRDPHTTIDYDHAAEERIDTRVARIGGDGKLLPSADGEVHLVTMVEKLLVPVLAKLSNLVPGGGIWMNTQRPEWNDANNALVGNGLSMVTACYLRRHLGDLAGLLAGSGLEEVEVSTEVADWADAVFAVLERYRDHLGGELSSTRRREVLDALGEGFSDYRSRLYAASFSGPRPVAVERLISLFRLAVEHLDDTIGRNRRPDGLFHSYNLVHFGNGEATIEHLDAMLEGQVAALNSGLLDAADKVTVLEALFAGEMYRQDQHSFMLYPARRLPSFLDKNVVPEGAVTASPLLAELAAAGIDSIVAVDGDGKYRFGPECVNRKALEQQLDRIAGEARWTEAVAQGRDGLLRAYEAVFNHHAYTGRSGSMYGYEGVGSIYWHMVAKLLVAVQEAVTEAKDRGVDPTIVDQLAAYYWRVRAGLGFEKTAAEFGAFPMDPYSHTPAHAGAQQPGMTGQVKEEILTRFLELGVRVNDGEICFDPILLRAAAFVESPVDWRMRTLDGDERVVEIPPQSLGMTICQVPVVVSLTDGAAAISVEGADGSVENIAGLRLGRELSSGIFARRGRAAFLQVSIPRSALRTAAEA